jgi:hypothetical protein
MRYRPPKLNQVDLLRLAWRYGGQTHRLFVTLLGSGPSLGLLLIVPAALSFSSARNYDEALQIMFTGILGLVTWAAFQGALYACLYSPNFWKAGIRDGWVPGVERDYYTELVRYQEARGTNGQLPGDVALGIAYFAIFLGGVAGSVVSVVLSYPLWGRAGFFLFAAIEYPLALGCWYRYRRRAHKRLVEAERDGFRLLTLQREIRRIVAQEVRSKIV